MNLSERLVSFFLKTVLTPVVGVTITGLGKRFYPQAISHGIEIKSVTLTLPRLSLEFHGYRVVQISDLHIGTWINRQRLSEIIHSINQLKPDLVAITGDFVTYHPERYAGNLVDCLRQLTPTDGTVAVLGNHDHWAGASVVRRILRMSGVVDLSNSIHTLCRGNAQLHIAGVDDYMNGRDRLDLVLDRLPWHGASILLVHEPDFADISAASSRFDLQLSGHTHGGQIRFPRLGPPFLPRHGRKYPIGYYRLGKMHLYTNRGLGTGELQLRLNCHPEVTVFTLLASSKEAS